MRRAEVVAKKAESMKSTKGGGLEEVAGVVVEMAHELKETVLGKACFRQSDRKHERERGHGSGGQNMLSAQVLRGHVRWVYEKEDRVTGVLKEKGELKKRCREEAARKG
jgi:hypothetical protein